MGVAVERQIDADSLSEIARRAPLRSRALITLGHLITAIPNGMAFAACRDFIPIDVVVR